MQANSDAARANDLLCCSRFFNADEILFEKRSKIVPFFSSAVVSIQKICGPHRKSSLMQVAGRLADDCLWRAVCLKDLNLTQRPIPFFSLRSCVIVLRLKINTCLMLLVTRRQRLQRFVDGLGLQENKG